MKEENTPEKLNHIGELIEIKYRSLDDLSSIEWLGFYLEAQEIANFSRGVDGRYFYIPLPHEYELFVTNRLDKDDPDCANITESTVALMRFIGPKKMLALIEMFGGKKITIPTERQLLIYVRNLAVVKLYKNPEDVIKLSMVFRLSQGKIRSIIARSHFIERKKMEASNILSKLKQASTNPKSPIANYYTYVQSNIKKATET